MPHLNHLALLVRPADPVRGQTGRTGPVTEFLDAALAVSFGEFGLPSLTLVGLDAALSEALAGEVTRRERQLQAEGVRVRWLGRPYAAASTAAPESAPEAAPADTRHTLTVGRHDYSGRTEILEAARRLIRDRLGDGAPGSCDPATLEAYLGTDGHPDPDLIVRLGPRGPLGDALLWQQAYAEFAAIETPWPEVTRDQLRAAIRAYGQRRRRYGGIGSPTADGGA